MPLPLQEDGTFDNNKKLEILNLEGNLLTSIQLGLFDQLKNLKELEIAKNRVAVFPDKPFVEGFPQMKIV